MSGRLIAVWQTLTARMGAVPKPMRIIASVFGLAVLCVVVVVFVNHVWGAEVTDRTLVYVSMIIAVGIMALYAGVKGD